VTVTDHGAFVLFNIYGAPCLPPPQPNLASQCFGGLTLLLRLSSVWCLTWLVMVCRTRHHERGGEGRAAALQDALLLREHLHDLA
jgi:hypothetical protein